METTMIGRDPDMDRAVARVARRMYELEETPNPGLDLVHELKVAARRLWSTTRNLPPISRQIVRPVVRNLIISCKEAEHAVRIGRGAPAAPIHQAFAEVVREYRISRLEQQVVLHARCRPAPHLLCEPWGTP